MLDLLSAFRPPSSIPTPQVGTPESWWNLFKCGSLASDCLNSPISEATSRCFKAFNYCFVAESWTSQITSTFDWALKNVSVAAVETLKPSLQQTANEFLIQCQAPTLPIGTSNGSVQANSIALAAIASFVAVQPFATNWYYQQKTALASSLNRGVIAGTAMSWLLNRDPVLGALSGAISGIAFDTALSYTIMPVFNAVRAQCERPYMRDTWRGSFRTAQHLSAIPVAGFLYNSGATPAVALLGAGTYLYLLQRPIGLIEGVVSHTAQFVGTFPGIVTGCAVAYGSGFLTSLLETAQASSPEISYLAFSVYAFGLQFLYNIAAPRVQLAEIGAH